MMYPMCLLASAILFVVVGSGSRAYALVTGTQETNVSGQTIVAGLSGVRDTYGSTSRFDTGSGVPSHRVTVSSLPRAHGGSIHEIPTSMNGTVFAEAGSDTSFVSFGNGGPSLHAGGRGGLIPRLPIEPDSVRLEPSSSPLKGDVSAVRANGRARIADVTAITSDVRAKTSTNIRPAGPVSSVAGFRQPSASTYPTRLQAIPFPPALVLSFAGLIALVLISRRGL